MIKNYFNDDLTNKGIEGYWYIENGKLIFFVEATNSKADWKSNLNALPKYDKYTGCFVHLGYFDYAAWLINFIQNVAYSEGFNESEIIIIGYSMGGGIAQMVGEDLTEARIVSIDGPRTTSKIRNKNTVLYYNRGSLVHNLPIWFKKIKNRICLNDKYQVFWKSHGNYDLDEIIDKEIYNERLA
jgi:pimeloyl-ACP methyl ester carboxylesterase